jgi:hypothetical protein
MMNLVEVTMPCELILCSYTRSPLTRVDLRRPFLPRIKTDQQGSGDSYIALDIIDLK